MAEAAAHLQEQSVNAEPQPNVNENQPNSEETPKFDKNESDNYEQQERQSTPEESVNLQNSTSRETDELSSMFDNAPVQDTQTRTYQQQAEKGRVLVKTPTSNNRGQATFLNLCFVFSTVAILGMIISTIILYAQKLFN